MCRTLVIAIAFLILSSSVHAENSKLAFWNQQRRGANGDAGVDPESWFTAAASFGIEFVRLSPATWKGSGRDFLLGDADHFNGIPPADLARLRTVLDVAQTHDVRIVLTMFSMPGARWRQHNDNRFDYGLWTDSTHQDQALRFCSELASEIGSHPALIAYNLLNEPHPERADGIHAGSGEFEKWQRQHEGTLADLNQFNSRMISAIRGVDSITPVILDGCFHASPDGLGYLQPVQDSAVLYAFHYYEPWEFVTYRINNGQYCYPDSMPSDTPGGKSRWTSVDLDNRLAPVREWARRTFTPSNRIVVGEFGCDRRVCGAQDYLDDLLTIIDSAGWHWAFYSFRASDWDGLDYELGTEKLGWKYWQAIDSGATHEELVVRHDNPLWSVIKSRLKPPFKH